MTAVIDRGYSFACLAFLLPKSLTSAGETQGRVMTSIFKFITLHISRQLADDRPQVVYKIAMDRCFRLPGVPILSFVSLYFCGKKLLISLQNNGIRKLRFIVD
jgi:hypothetical protein